MTREELIQLQMKEIQTALTAQNFRDAIGEQKQLLAKLQRLEQLLLSPDLDFQLQLERLRLMRDLLKRLDAEQVGLRQQYVEANGREPM